MRVREREGHGSPKDDLADKKSARVSQGKDETLGRRGTPAARAESAAQVPFTVGQRSRLGIDEEALAHSRGPSSL